MKRLVDADIGDFIYKGNKKYLVVDKEICVMGVVKIFYLLRVYKSWKPRLRFLKEVYDYELVKYYHYK